MAVDEVAKVLVNLSTDCEQLIVSGNGNFTVAEPIFLPKHTVLIGSSPDNLRALARLWMLKDTIVDVINRLEWNTDVEEEAADLLAKIGEITE